MKRFLIGVRSPLALIRNFFNKIFYFKKFVDNTAILAYYLTSTEVQIQRNKYHIADMFRKSNTKEEVCDGI